MSKINTGIVDDHQAIAQGLSSELSADGGFEVLFIISDKEKIIGALQNGVPDVLVMDVVMPGTLGIDSFKNVLKAYPDIKIIAYTALNSPLIIELLLRAGVKGYVAKSQPLSDLKEAISDVYYDRISLPEAYHFILKKIKANIKPEELSSREVEILGLIAAGNKTNEIAGLLGISVNTVESHRKNLFDKLKVNNLAGLIKAGFDLGYLK
ncbi:MAG TPA: response regulator transcription factor [Bacteroidia bacterium]|nr:response regulator transcription factor [Bacteroidia bacterium]